jgi:hypothetical protein
MSLRRTATIEIPDFGKQIAGTGRGENEDGYRQSKRRISAGIL